ncbi:hypothetical protein EVAR_37122_1 [Eumeta japonica]|uniref:Uncharacterized protein n=1 Tax=Eumeta variegata TaxID=151549 RepID=A0A4C1XRT7_EUMVA|nr:hypothetical protein EVAR_37122_1 [Eumeta japonica]
MTLHKPNSTLVDEVHKSRRSPVNLHRASDRKYGCTPAFALSAISATCGTHGRLEAESDAQKYGFTSKIKHEIVHEAFDDRTSTINLVVVPARGTMTEFTARNKIEQFFMALPIVRTTNYE